MLAKGPRDAQASEYGLTSQRTLRFVLATFGTNVVLGLLGLATSVITARLLGPQGRGELAAIMLLATVLSGPAMLGMGESVAYHVAKQLHRASAYTTAAISLSLLSALACGILGYIIVPAVLIDYTNSVTSAARYYLCYLVLAVLIGLPHQALRGIGRFGAWNALRILPALVWIAVLAMAYVWNDAHAVRLAMWQLMGLALLAVPIMLVCRRFLAGSSTPRIGEFASLLRFGLPAMLGSLPQIITSRVDHLVIATSFSAQSLGLYTVSAAWAAIVHPVIGSIGALVLPVVASKAAAADRVRVFAKVTRLSITISACMFLGMAAATPLLFSFVYGDAFRQAVPTAILLCGAATVVAVCAVVEEGFRGLGHPRYVVWAELLGASIAVPATIYLAGQYGLPGAAVAALLTSFSVLSTLLLLAKLVVRIDLRDMAVPRREELQTLVRHVFAALRLDSRGSE